MCLSIARMQPAPINGPESRSELGKWSVFAMCAFPYFLAHFHRVSISVIASDLQAEFGVSAYLLGLMSSMYFYAYAALQVPVGIAADRVSPGRMIATGTGIAAVGSQLFGMSRNYLPALIARTMTGIGVAMVYIPSLQLLAQAFGTHRFGTVSGLMIAVGNLGALSASSPFGLMVSHWGWRRSFMMIAVVSGLVALVCYRFLPGFRDQGRGRGAASIGGIAPVVGNDEPPKVFDRAKLPTFLLFGLMTFSKYGPAIAYQGLWGVPYLTDVYAMTRVQAGNVLMWIPIGYILGGPLVGWIGDAQRIDLPPLLSLTMGVYLLAWVPIAWVPMTWFTGSSSTVALCISGFLIGFMGGGSSVVIHSIVKHRAGEGSLGTGMGIVNACSLIGGAVYQPLMGALMDAGARATGSAVEAYRMAFRVAFLSAVLVFVLSVLFCLRSKKRSLGAGM